MASLIKHKNGTYYIEFYNKGKRVWRTLSTRDKSLAYIRYLEYEKKGIPQRPTVRPEQSSNSLTLKQALDDYFSYVKANFSVKTQCDYQSIIKDLMSFLGPEKPIAEIIVKDIEKYKGNKYKNNISPYTVNHNLRCIRAFFNLMVLWGLLEKSLCKGVKSIRIDETIRPYLSKEGLQTVLERTTGTQLHDIVLFAVLTGLRLGELVNLTWEDILLEKRKIIIRSNGNFRTKNGKMRVIPISSGLLKLLESMPDRTGLLFKSPKGSAYRTEFISKKFKRVIRACGLNKKLHFHSLRHTFGSYFVESGVSLFHVQQLMGHSSPYVTQIYAHLGTAELLSSVEKIELG